MSIEAYFTKSAAPLRMPRRMPGVRDAQGFVFYGPIGTGQIDVATAILRDIHQARQQMANQGGFGGPMENDPVHAPLANRIPAAPDPYDVAPHLDAAALGQPAVPLACAPPLTPVRETDRILAELRRRRF